MIITLIGFMGCGKSSVGKALAGKLGWDFSDSDSLVELGEQMKIPEIFSNYGEKRFRELEYMYIGKTIDRYDRGTAPGKHQGRNIIFSLGGGAPTYAPTARLIKERTFPIYLKCPVEELIENLRIDGTENRPVLAGHDLETRVRQLVAEREPVYSGCARMVIYPYSITPEIIRSIRFR